MGDELGDGFGGLLGHGGRVLGTLLAPTGLASVGLLGGVRTIPHLDLLDQDVLDGLVGGIAALQNFLHAVQSLLALLLLEQGFEFLGGKAGGDGEGGGIGAHVVSPCSCFESGI